MSPGPAPSSAALQRKLQIGKRTKDTWDEESIRSAIEAYLEKYIKGYDLNRFDEWWKKNVKNIEFEVTRSPTMIFDEQHFTLQSFPQATKEAMTKTDEKRRQYNVSSLAKYDDLTEAQQAKVRARVEGWNEGSNGWRRHRGLGGQYTMDLSNWDNTGGGRGNWRLQFHQDGTLHVVNHKGKEY